MSDHFIPPLPPIPLMSPERARDRARLFQAWANAMDAEGDTDEAHRAQRKATWWITYAIALAQTPPEDER